MDDKKTYYGWTNYETWCVALWFDNERESYERWLTTTRQFVEKAPIMFTSSIPEAFPHERATGALANRLRRELFENLPDVITGVYADLLRAAFSEVNWWEVAGHFVADVVGEHGIAEKGKPPQHKPCPSINAPWSLHFGRDGTNEFGVIRNVGGEELVTSRQFWLPDRTDPSPPTLDVLRVMTAAPELKEALVDLLTCTMHRSRKTSLQLSVEEHEATQAALKALLKAGERCPKLSLHSEFGTEHETEVNRQETAGQPGTEVLTEEEKVEKEK